MGKKGLFLLALVASAAFFGGIYYGQAKDAPEPLVTFHNIRINHAANFTSLVDPLDPAVVALANRFSSIEEAYYFVRDRIRFDPMRPVARPSEILAEQSASCLGKCVLLLNLYRAMGVPAEQVRIMVGELQFPEGRIDHAWIDMEYGDGCLEQDVSGLLGNFPFDQFPRGTYTAAFNGKGKFCFNDEGFAIVSQLNEMKHRQAPPR